MNFLSHHTVHAIENPEFNFGLLFPDFLGIISRSYKLKQFKKDFSKERPSLLLGIAHHELADGIWHESSFFKNKCSLIKSVLASYGFNERPFRPFFMSHVMLEILLDRAIVQASEDHADQMYRSLDAIDTDLIQQISRVNEATAEFGKFFASFRSNRYVFSYADNEMFIYALNRLFSRVHHPQLLFKDNSQRNSFVQELDELIETDYNTIVEDIRNERVH